MLLLEQLAARFNETLVTEATRSAIVSDNAIRD
jgi:hypothetical protein